MCYRYNNSCCSSQKHMFELPFVFISYFLGGKKMKRLLVQRPSASQGMKIPHASLILALSAVDNVLTQTMTTHNISLSEMTAMASPDRPE